MSKRLAVAVVTVVALAVAGVALVAGSDEESSAAGSGPSAASEASPVAASRTTIVPPPSGKAKGRVQRAAKPRGITRAKLDDSVALPGGVEVALTDLTVRRIKAQTPGDVSGRALVADIEITNGSDRAIGLDSSWIQVTFGSSPQVATPQASDPYRPLSGKLAPGAKATGTYVFSLGSARASNLRVLVTYDPTRPRAEFVGDIK